jgi:type IV secretion system protein TrbB
MVALKSEAAWRSVRMMRTAMEPTITHWLDDPAIVEIMLNPDGRLWIDRLAGASATPRSDCRRKAASASCVSSPTMSGAEVHLGSPRLTAELLDGAVARRSRCFTTFTPTKNAAAISSSDWPFWRNG